MENNSVKIVYSIKNIILLFSMIFFLVLMNTFFIFVETTSIVSEALIAIFTFYILYFIYLALNRINKISLSNGKILINRFTLSSLIFECKDISYISKDSLKIGGKSFNLRFVVNKGELIRFLLKAMEIKNIDEAISGILNGAHFFKNKEDMNKSNRKAKLALTVSIILISICFLATVILNHWSIIFVICTVILVGFNYLKDIIFKKKIENIASKFVRLLTNGIVNLVFIILTIALGIAIYNIFKIWSIDLMKVTF